MKIDSPLHFSIPVLAGALSLLACSNHDFDGRQHGGTHSRERSDAGRQRSPAQAQPRTGSGDAGATTDTGATDAGDEVDATEDAGTTADAAHDGSLPDAPAGDAGPPVTYAFDVRVHIQQTGLEREELEAVLAETQFIWASQAAICFNFHINANDTPLTTGFNLYYLPEIPGAPDVNGAIGGMHIVVRDHPVLAPAPNPAKYPAARTTAHELGHALTLQHYEDPVDFADALMASRQAGYRLHDFEIEDARRVARTFAVERGPGVPCMPLREE